MNGKYKCEILKEIRKKIAHDNNIQYNPIECDFQGDCIGSCPRCEKEVSYLNDAINKKSLNGEKIVINFEDIDYIREKYSKLSWTYKKSLSNYDDDTIQDLINVSNIDIIHDCIKSIDNEKLKNIYYIDENIIECLNHYNDIMGCTFDNDKIYHNIYGEIVRYIEKNLTQKEINTLYFLSKHICQSLDNIKILECLKKYMDDIDKINK
ncbi:MAG: hypothetical protein ACI4WH_05070 [Oscillospiraceae bacterium]